MTAPGCISGWVSAERGEKGKKHWRLEFEDNRSLLNSNPQFTVWSSHRIYLLWRAPAFFWKACVGPCPTAHSARIWKLTGQCTTGPMQSTGKACYSQAQCLKAYHQAPSLWLRREACASCEMAQWSSDSDPLLSFIISLLPWSWENHGRK